MPKVRVGHITVAVFGAYVMNAVLIAGTDRLLSSMLGNANSQLYLVIDLTSQCLYTVGAGYLCVAIAGGSQRVAVAGLITVGLAVGTASLIISWNAEPHWYALACFSFMHRACGLGKR